MVATLDMQAKQMRQLRRKNEQLKQQLEDIHEITRDNDAMVAMLHRLALLLLAREDDWVTPAQALLKRKLKISECHIMIISDNKSLATQIMRLPMGGRLDKIALCPHITQTAAKHGYYHLPLRRDRRAKGLLTLTLSQPLKQGADDFCRRLAELLSAAL